MLNEAVEAWQAPCTPWDQGGCPVAYGSDRLYVDGTVGCGGHSAELLVRDPHAIVVGIDRDAMALEAAQARLERVAPGRYFLVHGTYASLPSLLRELGLPPLVHGVLLDLGVSSPQLDDPDRGFSFLRDGPLDMRFDSLSPLPGERASLVSSASIGAAWGLRRESLESEEELHTSGDVTAADLVNYLSEADLVRLFRELGDEPRASVAARAIVAAREGQGLVFRTTGELASVLEYALGRSRTWSRPAQRRKQEDAASGHHPATRCFQALRIAVNDELAHVRRGLALLPRLLLPGGRLAVLSFQPSENKLIQRCFRSLDRSVGVLADLDPSRAQTAKPLPPSDDEVRRNPRARSALLWRARRAPPSSKWAMPSPAPAASSGGGGRLGPMRLAANAWSSAGAAAPGALRTAAASAEAELKSHAKLVSMLVEPAREQLAAVLLDPAELLLFVQPPPDDEAMVDADGDGHNAAPAPPTPTHAGEPKEPSVSQLRAERAVATDIHNSLRRAAAQAKQTRLDKVLAVDDDGGGGGSEAEESESESTTHNQQHQAQWLCNERGKKQAIVLRRGLLPHCLGSKGRLGEEFPAVVVLHTTNDAQKWIGTSGLAWTPDITTEHPAHVDPAASFPAPVPSDLRPTPPSQSPLSPIDEETRAFLASLPVQKRSPRVRSSSSS